MEEENSIKKSTIDHEVEQKCSTNESLLERIFLQQIRFQKIMWNSFQNDSDMNSVEEKCFLTISHAVCEVKIRYLIFRIYWNAEKNKHAHKTKVNYVCWGSSGMAQFVERLFFSINSILFQCDSEKSFFNNNFKIIKQVVLRKKKKKHCTLILWY